MQVGRHIVNLINTDYGAFVIPQIKPQAGSEDLVIGPVYAFKKYDLHVCMHQCGSVFNGHI